MHTRTLGLALASTAAAAALSLGLASAASAETYKVTIRNLTLGQVFSPPVVAAHPGSIQAFRAGKPASKPLEIMAEDGANNDLVEALENAGANVSVADGPVPPGKKSVVFVDADNGNSYITVLGMLVTTNDAFVGLNAVDPAEQGRSVYRAIAYDAGTEVNDEDCAHIPGPPCGNGKQEAITPGENGTDEGGVVHVHSGVHNLPNLSAAAETTAYVDARQHDWRNPVAEIRIRKVNSK